MKILVVDDEKDVEMLFRQKFRKEVRAGDIDFDSLKEKISIIINN